MRKLCIISLRSINKIFLFAAKRHFCLFIAISKTLRFIAIRNYLKISRNKRQSHKRLVCKTYHVAAIESMDYFTINLLQDSGTYFLHPVLRLSNNV